MINSNFETIIPGLAAGRYDLGASSFTDTKEREKTVDFVDYFTAGDSFYAKSSANPAIETLADLCGKTGGGREGHDRAGRSDDAERQVHQRRQEGRERARLPDAERASTSRSRAGARNSGWPTRRSWPTRSSSPTAPFKLVGESYGVGAVRARDPEEDRHDRSRSWRR